jgi:hypothetical protein
MRTSYILDPLVLSFVAAAIDHVAQVMRERVPQRMVVTNQLAQRTKIFMRVTRMPMNRIVIGPRHHIQPSICWKNNSSIAKAINIVTNATANPIIKREFTPSLPTATSASSCNNPRQIK